MQSVMVKSRVLVSRVFAAAVLAVAVFTAHSFGQEGVLDISLEVSGLFLLSIATLGRLWALMYISGNKSRELITEGPLFNGAPPAVLLQPRRRPRRWPGL